MSIDFRKYVDIISGVGGGNNVRQRELILRIITSNPFVSPGVVLEMSPQDVGTFFGSASEEAKRATQYGGYISPSIASADKISFSRWSPTGNGAKIIGNDTPKVLTALKAITAGSFSILLGAQTITVDDLDFSAAASMAAIATLVQTALQAADPSAAAATVVYGTDGPSRFTIGFPLTTLGKVQAFSVSSGAQDAGALLGITTAAAAINIQGVAAQSALDAFQASINVTNNFGSFLFIDDLTGDDSEAVAAYNNSLNIEFMFSHRTSRADAPDLAVRLASYAGTTLTLFDDTLPGEYPDQIPATIMAATDYNKRNAVQNYMYKQMPGITPLVTETSDSDAMDALRVNYYGQTATAGQMIAFYQRGYMMGLATAPTDQNIYANEMWLKDLAASQLMALQLSVPQVPANETGRAMVANTLQPVIEDATFNAVISVGKTLTPIQKIFIGQQTGDDTAWRAVESVGYVLTVEIEQYTTVSGATEYQAVYTLIYAKNDAIRKVVGTHTLI